MIRKLTFAIGMVVLAITSPVRAGVTYQYVTDQTSYTASPNGTVTANVYLDEFVTAGSSSLIAQYGGLGGVGFKINTATSGAFPATPEITGSTNQTGNGQVFAGATPGGTSTFPMQPGNTNLTAFKLQEAYTGPSATPAGSTISSATVSQDTTYQVLLGTVTFNVGTNVTPTTYTLAQQSGTSQTYYQTSPTPPTLVASSETFTVAAQAASVPEPSSMILCGIVFGFAFVGYRRRMQGAKVAVAAI